MEKTKVRSKRLQEDTKGGRTVEQKKKNAANRQTEQSPLLFALDIGTRSIIGIVCRAVDEKLEILDHVRQEYNSRVMIDGQIDNIEKVSKCIVEVKETLEGRLGVQLTQVAIAAAGRALQTCQLTIQHLFKSSEIIGADLLRNMEMEGIIQAQKQIMTENAENGQEFYCVGHTVTGYVLDGYGMQEVLEHRGSHCEMTMIAAFLPKIVVESLYAVIERSNLKVMSMTLEPIAAMNVVIPPDLRMLNLALVDIGAGTSDIALSRSGTVVAYDMVTVAGDEVTEAIMRQYLVDFPTAEVMKRQLEEQERITFTDILGFDHEVASAEIFEYLKPVIEQMVKDISDKIVALNGAAPTAMFLVGGGSLYPHFTEVFARTLGMDEKRVAVGGKAHIQKVIYDYPGFHTPEYVTPIGIALTASQQDNQYFATVTVNGKTIRQFRFEGMKVSDVLILAGQYKYHQLAGTMGKPLRFTLNDQVQTISGGLAKPASIKRNGKKATMDTVVKAGDDILVKPAVKGKDAQRTIGQILKGYGRFQVSVDGQTYWAGSWAEKDGQILSEDYSVMDGDVFTSISLKTIADLFAYYQIRSHHKRCLLNGAETSLSTELAEDDLIAFEALAAVVADQQEAALEDDPVYSGESSLMEEEDVAFPEREHEGEIEEPVCREEVPAPSIESPPGPGIEEPTAEITVSAETPIEPEEPLLTVWLNGTKLPLYPRAEGAYMLFDLLNYVEDSMLLQHNKVSKCLLNGAEQPFTTLLAEGDEIIIH